MRSTLILMLAMIGCNKPKDEDGDGFASDEDCNDADAAIFPGAEDICDSIDNDCDGDTDEEGEAWYLDADGDGFGRDDADYNVLSCDQPAGFVDNGNDCDDLNADIFPETTWYVDSDGDGYGDPDAGETLCEQPSGSVENAEDCDDADADVNPDSIWYVDDDGDGYGNPSSEPIAQCEQPDGYAPNPEDCDDSSAGRSPETVWYQDADLDGYGDMDSTLQSCLAPAGFVANSEDCDDASELNSPEADEVCNDDVDNNCDGVADACEMDLANADVRIYGDGTQEFGTTVLAVGDLDGAGSVDLVVAAPADDTMGTNAGAIYLFSGPFVAGDLDTSDASAVLYGSEDEEAGKRLSGGLDINGDGEVDLLVSAHRANPSKRGAAHILYGPIEGDLVLATDADVSFTGGFNFDRFGDGVWLTEDVSGDGLNDMVMSAPYGESGGSSGGANGTVYVVAGPSPGSGFVGDIDNSFSWAVHGSYDGEQLGRAIAFGDYDGDGVDDLVMGSPKALNGADEVGGVYVMYGGVGDGTYDIGDADVVMYGEAIRDLAGDAVANAGDLDNDGVEDFLVGAPDADGGGISSGSVYGLLGGSPSGLLGDSTIVLTGSRSGDRAGEAIDSGDFNGDDDTDLLIGGTLGGDFDEGMTVLVLGPVSGTVDLANADGLLRGEDVYDKAGASVDFAGDLSESGDGLDDIAVGAPNNVTAGLDAGAVYLVFDVGL